MVFLESELFATVGVYNDGCDSRIIWFDGSLRYGPDPILDLFEGEDETKEFRGEPLYITVSCLCHVCSVQENEMLMLLYCSKAMCNRWASYSCDLGRFKYSFIC